MEGYSVGEKKTKQEEGRVKAAASKYSDSPRAKKAPGARVTNKKVLGRNGRATIGGEHRDGINDGWDGIE